jgi:hypothetical protein
MLRRMDHFVLEIDEILCLSTIDNGHIPIVNATAIPATQ